MMGWSLVRRVFLLPADERRWLAEAAVSLVLARLCLWLLPFSWVVRCHGLRPEPARPRPALVEGTHPIGLAVSRVAGRMPFRALCLQQALAAARMLRRRGLPVEVHIGVARAPGSDLTAHAWCLSGETAVTGAREADQFAPVAVLTAPATPNTRRSLRFFS